MTEQSGLKNGSNQNTQKTDDIDDFYHGMENMQAGKALYKR